MCTSAEYIISSCSEKTSHEILKKEADILGLLWNRDLSYGSIALELYKMTGTMTDT